MVGDLLVDVRGEKFKYFEIFFQTLYLIRKGFFEARSKGVSCYQTFLDDRISPAYLAALMNQPSTIRFRFGIAFLVLVLSLAPATILWEKPSQVVENAPMDALFEAFPKCHTPAALATGGKKFATHRAQMESDLPTPSAAVPPQSCLTVRVKVVDLSSMCRMEVLADGNRAPPALRV